VQPLAVYTFGEKDVVGEQLCTPKLESTNREWREYKLSRLTEGLPPEVISVCVLWQNTEELQECSLEPANNVVGQIAILRNELEIIVRLFCSNFLAWFDW
jgi:hypothetical protein